MTWRLFALIFLALLSLAWRRRPGASTTHVRGQLVGDWSISSAAASSTSLSIFCHHSLQAAQSVYKIGVGSGMIRSKFRQNAENYRIVGGGHFVRNGLRTGGVRG